MSGITTKYHINQELHLENSISGLTGSLPKTSTCEKCKKAGSKICGKCKTTTYCSYKCQKDDWKRHKIVCKNQELKEETKLEHKSVTEESNGSTLYSQLSKIKATYEDAFIKKYPMCILGNESGEKKAIGALKLLKAKGELYIGTGCLSNLNLASAIKGINHIIIIDPSSNVGKLWKQIIPLIKSSSNKDDCRKKITELAKKIWGFSGISNYEIALQKLEKSKSWLSDDFRYEKINKIFVDDRFLYLPFDLTDFTVTEKIKEIFKDHQMSVGTVYLSNVSEFICPQRLKAYERSLNGLLDPHTIIVDTEERSFCTTSFLTQISFKTTTLINHITSLAKYGCGEPVNLMMRVTERKGKSIKEIYPIMELLEKSEPDQSIFFKYGLKRGYYDSKTAEKIDKAILRDQPKSVQGIMKIAASKFKKDASKKDDVKKVISMKG